MWRSRVSHGEGCSLAIYKGLRPALARRSGRNLCQGSEMPPILTPEDVVRRIAAERVFVDDPGAVGIRLKAAAAIVRQYENQFRAPRRRRRSHPPKPPPLL